MTLRELQDQEFSMFQEYIKKTMGINLGEEKKSLVYSRLKNVVEEKGFNDFTEYFKYLTNDRSGQAMTQFINRITTNQTYFMRETDHFDFFKENVLPYIEQSAAATHDARVWCAGCSSGEEAYTLQMLMQDYFKGKPANWNTQLLATDISTSVLDKAVAGQYPGEGIKTLPQSWRDAYFTKDKVKDVYQVKDSLKKDIVFRKFNLMMERFPFKKPFHTIFCRNVMIYFDNDTRGELVNKYYDHLEKGGYLFIGHSESLSHHNTPFVFVKPAVYRKPLS